MHGCIGEIGILVDEIDHLGHAHETVRVLACVVESRQTTLPIGRQQLQRIPALVAPGVRDLAALEHDVLDRTLAEEIARRQPGVASTNDDDVSGADRPDQLSQDVDHLLTSTLTLVGFVMMSKTAERF